MSNHLHFLDFPIEIREMVYHELLCTWEMKHKRERACLRTRYHNPSAILCTNQQIYNEAYDYLVRRNQFVRLDCEGISIRFLPLGRQILPVTDNSRKISQFKGYVARVNWSTRIDVSQNRSRTQYMVLGSQFPDILKCTDYHSMTRWPAITLNIVLDPISTYWKGNLAPVQTAPPLRSFQINLLHIIPMLLHAFPRLTLQGSLIPKDLSTRIIDETAQPRWTHPTTALSSLLWFKHANERLGTEAYYLSSNAVIECGLQTLEVMRTSSAWAELKRTGGPTFVNTVAELRFEFLLCRAQRALEAMARSQCRRNLVEMFGEHAEGDLGACLAFDTEFTTWKPSEKHVALVVCMAAKRYRLLLDAEHRDVAVRSVEDAVRVLPDSEMVREEREAVKAWSMHVDRYFEEVQVSFAGPEIAMWEWWQEGEKFCDC